jgi:metallo-beta-lactamase family protein
MDAVNLLQPLPGKDETLRLFQNSKAAFTNAGHILGSRSILLHLNEPGEPEIRILFSGDIGQYTRPILPDPAPPPSCDYLLVESTYGDRLHPSRDPADALAEVINRAAGRKSPILIPAFAVDRTQELVYMIRELEDAKKIPVLPVRVDSPMALAATEVYARLKEEQDEEYRSVSESGRRPLTTRNMIIAGSRQDSRKLNHENGTRIIISAAGMMTGGRVLHHAQQILPDPDATVIFVGYQAEGTTGRLIKDGAEMVSIYKSMCRVRCHVEIVDGLSSHADYNDTLHWLSYMQGIPKTTFIVHGEPAAAEALQDRIEAKPGWRAVLPKLGQQCELT